MATKGKNIFNTNIKYGPDITAPQILMLLSTPLEKQKTNGTVLANFQAFINVTNTTDPYRVPVDLDPRSEITDPRSGSKIQDSRKNFLDPRSGSKILGKTSWILGLAPRSKSKIQDSRKISKAWIQDRRLWKKLLGSKVWIQDPRLQKKLLDPRTGSKIQDSRKNFLDPRSGPKIQGPRFQKIHLGS